jgi:hypothetical protein
LCPFGRGQGRRRWWKAGGFGQLLWGKKKSKAWGGVDGFFFFWVRDRFRFRVFFLYFSDVSKLPPSLFVCVEGYYL